MWSVYPRSWQCRRFGVGMLVPLQGAAAGCCCDRIFLRNTRRRSPWRVVAKKKMCSQNTSSVLANEPRFRIGKFVVWFGYDSGYDSETHFFEFRKLCWLSMIESFFPTFNLPRSLLNGSSGSTCQATLQRTWIWRIWRSKYTSKRKREREREWERWMDVWVDG